MTSAIEELPEALSASRIFAHQSSDPEVLGRIHEADCNLTIWQRQPIADVEAVMGQNARDLRFTAWEQDLRDRLDSEMANNGFAPHPAKIALIEDIASLANRFCAIMQVREIELRLEVVTTNSCRKFHADYVPARLITTYVGTGTQWLGQDDARRVAAGDKPETIHTLNAGDVGIFKGKLATMHPAIHRSPAIEGTGERRLLAVLNLPEGRQT